MKIVKKLIIFWKRGSLSNRYLKNFWTKSGIHSSKYYKNLRDIKNEHFTQYYLNQDDHLYFMYIYYKKIINS